jgi:hypothetical protein
MCTIDCGPSIGFFFIVLAQRAHLTLPGQFAAEY